MDGEWYFLVCILTHMSRQDGNVLSQQKLSIHVLHWCSRLEAGYPKVLLSKTESTTLHWCSRLEVGYPKVLLSKISLY